MNTDYIRLAYERTVIADCRRHLMEKYLQGGGSIKDVLICESVPYELREVPNEVFVEIIQRLEEDEKRLTDEMAQFEFRKRDARHSLLRKPEPPAPGDQPDPDAPREGQPPDGAGAVSGGDPPSPGSSQ